MPRPSFAPPGKRDLGFYGVDPEKSLGQKRWIRQLSIGSTSIRALASDPDLREIVDLFVEEMPGRVAGMLEQLRAADWEGLRRSAHQLRGAAGSYGFDPISPSAGKVEAAIRDGEPEQRIRETVDELVDLVHSCAVRPAATIGIGLEIGAASRPSLPHPTLVSQGVPASCICGAGRFVGQPMAVVPLPAVVDKSSSLPQCMDFGKVLPRFGGLETGAHAVPSENQVRKIGPLLHSCNSVFAWASWAFRRIASPVPRAACPRARPLSRWPAFAPARPPPSPHSVGSALEAPAASFWRQPCPPSGTAHPAVAAPTPDRRR